MFAIRSPPPRARVAPDELPRSVARRAPECDSAARDAGDHAQLHVSFIVSKATYSTKLFLFVVGV